ncbi:anthranilate synthase component I family protein [Sphingobacterium sp. HJSM2_6]|uniref:anthranilate synthase component I family protein n=1 Tax=Sphingobacterium sp. HJSM2_6 TaxID=3366264 RepID=UPI003BC4DB42
MAKAIFETNTKQFLAKCLQWSKSYQHVCLFHSNGFQDQYSTIHSLLAIGAKDEFSAQAGQAFAALEDFKSRHKGSFMPGFFSYELKNELETLNSKEQNVLEFPDAYFFIPQISIVFYGNSIEISCEEDPQILFNNIIQTAEIADSENFQIHIQPKMQKEEYMEAFHSMIQHIQRGDIYEANLCQEFFDDNAHIAHPEQLFLKLNTLSPTPFASFFKINKHYIISASPERFLAKRGNTLISQPIKGTAPRGRSPEEDQQLKDKLKSNPKEIAENVMIVDLVRNDLTRSAVPGTVQVTEKLGLYSFKQVHQLISTITCIKDQHISDIQAIKNTFPAGSMTGAPKLSAMKICDQLEKSRRGIYSGSIGYFDANGDFDFNVVIRTILYNQHKNYLSFHTGGAITIDANAEAEYEECLTKASAILKALNQTIK